MFGACMDEPDESATDQALEVDDVDVPEDLALDTSAELTGSHRPDLSTSEVVGVIEASGRYCVNQSSAAADSVSCEGQFMACKNTNWDTRLSRNHALSVSECGSGTYVIGHSYWNQGRCYLIRRDALRKC